MLRASDLLLDGLGESNNPEWKTVAYNSVIWELVALNGSIGFRWGEKANGISPADGKDVELKLSLLDIRDSVVSVGFPTLAATKPAFSQRSAVTGDPSPATG